MPARRGGRGANGVRGPQAGGGSNLITVFRQAFATPCDFVDPPLPLLDSLRATRRSGGRLQGRPYVPLASWLPLEAEPQWASWARRSSSLPTNRTTTNRHTTRRSPPVWTTASRSSGADEPVEERLEQFVGGSLVRELGAAEAVHLVAGEPQLAIPPRHGGVATR